MFEGLIAYHPGDRNRTGWQWLSFQAGNLHGRCRARIRGGFGRLRLDTSSLTLERNQKPVSLSVTTLVAQLPATNSHQQSLLTELLATISNSERLDALRKARHSGDRRNLHGEALDSALHEGHPPYHPCFKSRLGFQGDDLVHYSPETSTGFRLHWVAIPPRHNLDSQLPSSDMAFWQSELGQEQAYLLRAAFHRAGVDWQQYGALPTHPWHWQKLSQGPSPPGLRHWASNAWGGLWETVTIQAVAQVSIQCQPASESLRQTAFGHSQYLVTPASGAPPFRAIGSCHQPLARVHCRRRSTV